MSDIREDEDLLPPNPVVEAEAEARSNTPPPPNFFEFRDVNKAFDDHVVLDDVSFAVKRGETCVIMGRSGVGKSVSLKHIMGFLKADSGQILVDGEDITDYNEREFEEMRRKRDDGFSVGRAV